MEVPHDPRYDDIERDVEEMFRLSDLAIHALYNRILSSRDEEDA